MNREPDWVRHAIWWHVYPLGFTGADVTGADRSARGGFDQLVGWLDHAVELGASGIALGPVFESATHGYDTLDHLRIDARLGDDAGFDRLIDQAHDRGLKVLLDGVFNHVASSHPRFLAATANGPDSPEARWFRLRDGHAETFEGHGALVTLNHDEPAVVGHVTDAMLHWLGRGADGWRLDAAYAVPPRFWARVLPRIRAEYPNAYLVGEVIHGDYAGFVTESGLHAVTQYELWKAIWSSFNDRNLFELGHAIGRHAEMLATFVPQTFVGNHDVTRIASRLDDERHLPLALAVLFTLPGTPSVYAGDEHAFRGVKEERAGGDDAVRPPFPASPSELSRLGEPTFRLHRELIGVRRRHPWLHDATVEVTATANERLEYRLGARDGAQRLDVVLDLDAGTWQIEGPA